MNKKLIKKYKAEFEHFLNGGSISTYPLPFDKNGRWHEDNHSFDWAHPGYAVIINDAHVEFRKAQAEGKTIQLIVKHNDGCSQDSYVNYTGECMFEYPLNYYRIKPDKPTFKVGDWVRIPEKLHLVKIATLFRDGYTNYCSDRDIKPYKIHCSHRWDINNVTLWKPTIGEQCVFWNNNDTAFHVVSTYEDLREDLRYVQGGAGYDNVAPLTFNMDQYNNTESL